MTESTNFFTTITNFNYGITKEIFDFVYFDIGIDSYFIAMLVALFIVFLPYIALQVTLIFRNRFTIFGTTLANVFMITLLSSIIRNSENFYRQLEIGTGMLNLFFIGSIITGFIVIGLKRDFGSESERA